MSGPPTFPPNRSRPVKAAALADEDFSVGYLRKQLANYKAAFYDATDAAEKIKPYGPAFGSVHHKDRVMAAFKGKSGEAVTRSVLAGVKAYLIAHPGEQKQLNLRIKHGLNGFGIDRRMEFGRAPQRATEFAQKLERAKGRARTVWPNGKPPRKLPAPTQLNDH